jgi:tetratricopeptide (TPR) repeat protein
MRYILIIFALLFCEFSFSQEREIDSLQLHFSTIQSDSLKTIEISKSLVYYYGKSNFEIFNKLTEIDLKRQATLKNESVTALRLLMFGNFYKKIGSLDSAIVKYDKSLAIYKHLKDTVGITNVNSSMANVLKSKGDFDNAILKFNQVLRFFEKQPSKYQKNIVITKINLGALYSRMEAWAKADAINEEIFVSPIIKNNNRIYSSICINLVASKTKLKKYKEALKFAKIAEKIEIRPKSLANLYNNIGNIFVEQLNYKDAHKYYNKSLAQYKKAGSKDGVLKSYNNLGNNLTKWGRLNEAEMYLLKSNKLLIKDGSPNSLIYNYEMLRDLYNKKKNYKSSLNYYDLAQKLRDSIFGIEKQKAIADIEVKYETEKTKLEKQKAEQQVIVSQLESKKNRNLFIGSIAITVLLLLSSLFYFDRLKVKKQAELVILELKETQKRLAIEKQYKDSELKALKAQMNPHFIFNALNSIQDYIVLNQKNLASDYLGKFADLIRNYLHFSDTGFISIADEVHNLNLYLELEKLRFEDLLNYSFKVDENMNSETIKIPTMLIQPYVENALKHGLLHKKEDRRLSVIINKISDSIVECIIEDNGVGRVKSKEIKAKNEFQHQSFASKATSQRLDLLNFGKEQKIGVEIIDLLKEDKAIGTRVVLKIPVIKKDI